jgi:hypothetical protein
VKWLPRKAKKLKLVKDEGVEARNKLNQVHSKWPEINDLVDRLDSLNETNGFTRLITEAMRGGRT